MSFCVYNRGVLLRLSKKVFPWQTSSLPVLQLGKMLLFLSARDARMVLDFPTDQISIERPQNSDSLFFRFDDGGSIELQNFYTQYHKDDVPLV